MMSSSQSQGGDVSHAPLTEPAPSTDDDLVQGSPDSTVTPGSDEHVDCIEAETAAALHLDECDAVVAEDVPTLSEVVAELEMNVKHPHQRQVPVAEPAQIPSVKIIQSETTEASTAAPEQCDIFLITSDEDQENASKFASILIKFCKSCCNYKLTIYPELDFGGNKLEHLRSGLAHSKYRFIFIDNGFREENLVKFGTDAALMDMIDKGDQSIVPVKAHGGIGTPSLLRMFRSLDVQRLLNGKRLDDVDVDLLAKTDVRESVLKNIVKMVSKSDFGSSSKLSSAEYSPRMASQHSEILRKHFVCLADRMDPDNGLVSHLFSAGVVNRREMENIRAEKTIYDRNEYLLKLLMRKCEGDYLKFIDKLREVDQSSVADILCPSSASEQQSVDR